jgi:hypothetical protein
MNNTQCAIWGTHAKFFSTCRDGRIIKSARAGGTYFISRTAEVNLKNGDPSVRQRLTTWLIDQRKIGVECPEIMSNILNDVSNKRSLLVHERALRLLIFIRDSTEQIGRHFRFSLRFIDVELNTWRESDIFSYMKAHSESSEESDAFSPDQDETMYLINYLSSETLIQNIVFNANIPGETGIFEYIITPQGFAALANLDNKVTESKQAFIAMWFDDSMTNTYDNGIAPAVRDAGYEPMRIDRSEHNNKIDDEIVSEIRRSKFLVADFTQGEMGARGGVYYEAGFAHGLNIPVIFCCREDAIGNVHFDTRQYNHIIWNTPEELRTKLAQRISATVGDGPIRNKLE